MSVAGILERTEGDDMGKLMDNSVIHGIFIGTIEVVGANFDVIEGRKSVHPCPA
jgi:hypothetical protein